ncbi:hypothetical protein QLL95_gp0342 [Cotonvirus japonicus]|uniref:Uncharacterized protein n=1 Tax=Cotonvirus japonicus TaxID=2811091 RepID=A0ABM7NUN3_9VIRU|nr:hypothetical protein QLL95_gp0342 [Cotonvirus japonicus]BCS83781.1 hypothetical protein [Cotonvirus japonicus]
MKNNCNIQLYVQSIKFITKSHDKINKYVLFVLDRIINFLNDEFAEVQNYVIEYENITIRESNNDKNEKFLYDKKTQIKKHLVSNYRGITLPIINKFKITKDESHEKNINLKIYKPILLTKTEKINLPNKYKNNFKDCKIEIIIDDCKYASSPFDTIESKNNDIILKCERKIMITQSKQYPNENSDFIYKKIKLLFDEPIIIISKNNIGHIEDLFFKINIDGINFTNKDDGFEYRLNKCPIIDLNDVDNIYVPTGHTYPIRRIYGMEYYESHTDYINFMFDTKKSRSRMSMNMLMEKNPINYPDLMNMFNKISKIFKPVSNVEINYKLLPFIGKNIKNKPIKNKSDIYIYYGKENLLKQKKKYIKWVKQNEQLNYVHNHIQKEVNYYF